jgi:hypothetical protein
MDDLDDCAELSVTLDFPSLGWIGGLIRYSLSIFANTPTNHLRHFLMNHCPCMNQRYVSELVAILGAETVVNSSTQVEMIALITAFEHIARNLIGRTVQIHSDCLSSLSYIDNYYWKASISDSQK